MTGFDGGRLSRERVSAHGWVTVGVLAAVGMLVVGFVPVLAAGTATTISPVVSRGASLSIHPFVASNTHDYNASAATCYRAGSGIDLCNVTITVNLSSACGAPGGGPCHQLLAYNYSIVGTSAAPTSFYVINSDPTLPIPGLNVSSASCKADCGRSTVTLGIWFHVNQPTGTISVWLQVDTLT